MAAVIGPGARPSPPGAWSCAVASTTGCAWPSATVPRPCVRSAARPSASPERTASPPPAAASGSGRCSACRSATPSAATSTSPCCRPWRSSAIHAFSLVHDDIADGDRVRRGRPSLWARAGTGPALNAGDALMALGLGLAWRASPWAAALIHSATLSMIEGQHLDMSAEGCDRRKRRRVGAAGDAQDRGALRRRQRRRGGDRAGRRRRHRRVLLAARRAARARLPGPRRHPRHVGRPRAHRQAGGRRPRPAQGEPARRRRPRRRRAPGSPPPSTTRRAASTTSSACSRPPAPAPRPRGRGTTTAAPSRPCSTSSSPTARAAPRSAPCWRRCGTAARDPARGAAPRPAAARRLARPRPAARRRLRPRPRRPARPAARRRPLVLPAAEQRVHGGRVPPAGRILGRSTPSASAARHPHPRRPAPRRRLPDVRRRDPPTPTSPSRRSPRSAPPGCPPTIPGSPPPAPPRSRLGGVAATRVFTRMWLACAGLRPWDGLPELPPEMLFLPERAPLGLMRFASWARATIVPLTVVMTLRPASDAVVLEPGALPEGEPADPGARSPAARWRASSSASTGCSRAYRRLPRQPGRARALARAEAWIIDHQDVDGAIGAIQPPMAYQCLALHALGHRRGSPALERAWNAFEGFVLDDGESCEMQACVSPVWDTALAMLRPRRPRRRARPRGDARAARWLLDRRSGSAATGRRCAPGSPPGAGRSSTTTTSTPTSTTPRSCSARSAPPRSRDATTRCSGGCAGCSGCAAATAELPPSMPRTRAGWWDGIPFCDFGAVTDPPSADVTAHVLEAAARFGLGATHRDVAAMRGWLSATRRRTAPGSAAGG